MPTRRLRPLRLPIGVLTLSLVPLLALQQLAPVLFPAQYRVMQISLPVPRYLAAAREAAARRDAYYRSQLPPGAPLVISLPANLDQRVYWHSYALTGRARHDAAMLRAAAEQILHYQRWPERRRGVRLVFSSTARYAQLVAALDAVQQTGAMKYALDLERAEPALYVFGPGGYAW
jgi:hypothetical protein